MKMALKDTVHTMKKLLHDIAHDIQKAEGGNKAASQRVRTHSIKLEKTAKLYRKESIAAEKKERKPKKAPKASAHVKKAKVHSHHAMKRPTAKLPSKRR
jgi:hypothetical protein